MKPQYKQQDNKRLLLAMALCAVLMVTWQIFVEAPKRAQIAQWNDQQAKQHEIKKEKEIQKLKEQAAMPKSESAALAESARITIDSPKLKGSFTTRGLEFDNLQLLTYKETLDENSKPVTLLTPQATELPYFAHVGWLATDGTKVPDKNAVWQADKTTLKPGAPVTLTWNNGAGVTFITRIALDDAYMFTIEQVVENRSGGSINVSPYAFINRTHSDASVMTAISHEGPLGVLAGKLDEFSYSDLKEKGTKEFADAKGWLGFTDKYWLTAFIPAQDTGFKATFSHYISKDVDRYQADYLGAAKTVAAGASENFTTRFFAGAKEINELDAYTEGKKGGEPIPLFDRAVDFGVLYFLTKPFFLALDGFYALIGNFGIAILLLTIVVKIFMYPLASKAYHATAKMRILQPEMVRLKAEAGNDRMKLQKDMMELYKKEGVNPAAGCLPLLIQIPVFFALYKVLFVTIEMRHAPFFGWLRDLSAADTSNIFTAFGLIPWDPPTLLHLGILPILFCITMVIQMKQQPQPTDPTQAAIFKWMPYAFLVMFAKMPAGLVLYWTWSNVLSIIQQFIITRHDRKEMAEEKAKAKALKKAHKKKK